MKKLFFLSLIGTALLLACQSPESGNESKDEDAKNESVEKATEKNKEVKEGRPHAAGTTVTTLQNGIIDTGNICDIDYNSITQYEEDINQNKKFIVFVKKSIASR